MGGRARIHVYADGSIDGEMLAKIPRGVPVSDFVQKAYDALPPSFDRTIWLSVGLRYEIRKDDLVYRKVSGMNVVETLPMRATRGRIAESVVTLRHKVLKGMAKMTGRKASMFFMRLHWNLDGVKPERVEGRNKQGRGDVRK